jgi:hypothetical protein
MPPEMMPSEYDSLDKIVIEEKISKGIIEWWKANFRPGTTFEHVPLQKGIIQFGTSKATVDQFKDATLMFQDIPHRQGFMMEIFGDKKYIITWFILYEMKDHNFQIHFPESSKPHITQSIYELVMTATGCWGAIMTYMMEAKTEYIQVDEQRVPKAKKGKGGKGKKVSYIRKKVYRVFLPDPEQPKRAIERHVEAWGVRGHMRRYKNGKQVWVKEHIRGTGKKEPKEYRIGGIDSELNNKHSQT